MDSERIWEVGMSTFLVKSVDGKKERRMQADS